MIVEDIWRNSTFATTSVLRLGVEDAERMTKSVKGIVGKRLTYKPATAN